MNFMLNIEEIKERNKKMFYLKKREKVDKIKKIYIFREIAINCYKYLQIKMKKKK